MPGRGGCRRRSTRPPIRGSRRSNPATYTGLLDPIRKAFAKANGVKPALFSANSEGACPTCNGAGVIYTDLAMMAERRHHLRGVRGQAVPGLGAGVPPRRPGHQRGAGDAGDRGRGVLRRRRGAHPGRAPILERLADVGLGYLTLGQPLTTLSGGERQRLSWPRTWATRAASTSSTSRPPVCTWPTWSSCSACSTGSSTPASRSSSIEHHQAVMAHADWIIDLGPGAGHDGGRIVFEGTPGRPRRGPLHAHRRSIWRPTWAPEGGRTAVRRAARRVPGPASRPIAAMSDIENKSGEYRHPVRALRLLNPPRNGATDDHQENA